MTSPLERQDPLLDETNLEQDDDSTADADHQLCLARIEEYRHERVHEDVHLSAILGYSAATALEFSVLFGKNVGALLRTNKTPVHEMADLQRALMTYSNLNRQAQRFIDLADRLDQSKRKTQSSPSRSRSPGGFNLLQKPH